MHHLLEMYLRSTLFKANRHLKIDDSNLTIEIIKPCKYALALISFWLEIPYQWLSR